MKPIYAFILVIVTLNADVFANIYEEGVNNDHRQGGMDAFFERLYPSPAAVNKAKASEAAPKQTLLAPIDPSYIMSEVGKTVEASIRSVVENLFDTIFDLIFGGDERKVFADKTDFLAFGQSLQTAADHIFTTSTTHGTEVKATFQDEIKQELFNTLVHWLIQFRATEGKVLGPLQKPDINKIFKRIAEKHMISE